MNKEIFGWKFITKLNSLPLHLLSKKKEWCGTFNVSRVLKNLSWTKHKRFEYFLSAHVMRKSTKSILLKKKIFLIMNSEFSIWILNSGMLVKFKNRLSLQRWKEDLFLVFVNFHDENTLRLISTYLFVLIKWKQRRDGNNRLYEPL